MLLNGIVVIECSQVLSAPYAGMILADLGAQVIKVEKPMSGDDARKMGSAFLDDASMLFQDVNRNKESVIVDLKTPEGYESILKLLGSADIFIHNFRPGDAEKLKLDGPTLTQKFPRLIYCEMGAFGHKGPKRMLPGYEPLMQAYSGLISMTGDPSSPPARIPASLVDEGTGMWTVIAALSALHSRNNSGKGCVINTSLLETAVSWAAPRIHEWKNEGRISERLGTGHSNLVPYQAFETADGLLMICAGNDRLFSKVAITLSHPEWLSDERFCTNQTRLKHRDSLVELMTAQLRTNSRSFWTEKLQMAGVPVSPVQSIEEISVDPHVKALDLIRRVPDHNFELTGLPISFNDERPKILKRAPKLGEHQHRLKPKS